jgi:two-component system response regulator NreC
MPAMETAKIRVLLADDHSLVRQGFRRILEGQPSFIVVGEASNGRQAVEMVAQFHPDVLVMDVTMPELNGIEATRQVARQFPRTRVLALSMQKDGVYVREMLRAGARGYLLKECTETDLVSAIREVAAGKAWLSPDVGGAVLEDYRKHVSEPIDLLSTREREVLQGIAEGKTNKELAVRFGLSVYTVEAHRGRIMEKLNLHSGNELVRFAIRHGLVD